MKPLCLLIALLLPLAATAGPAAGQCPQPRYTDKAPADLLARANPETADRAGLRAAERIYRGKAGHFGCAACHGRKGDGRGELSGSFDPPPRNFACAETVNGIPDGQLYWIIRNGSPGTGMPAHPELSEREAWLLVHYLRRLAQ